MVTTRPSEPPFAIAAKLSSKSLGFPENASNSRLSVRAAVCKRAISKTMLGLSGFHSTATRCSFGSVSFSSSSHFAL